MPRGDRTGPMGAGAMTGRGLGSCRNVLWKMGAGIGLGLGMRYAFRRNLEQDPRQGPLPSVETKNALIAQKEYLLENLQKIDQELRKLKK